MSPSRKVLRQRMCERKVRHATRSDAERALAVMQRTGRSGLDVYRCPYCDCFHIGRRKRRAS